MNSGLMDRLIILQSPSWGTDSFGKKATPTWTQYASIWARFQSNGGSESISANKKEFRENATFTVHFRAAISTKDRIYYDSKYWNIVSISEVGRRQYTRMEAVTVE